MSSRWRCVAVLWLALLNTGPRDPIGRQIRIDTASGSGSGVEVADDLVITADHVIACDAKVRVSVADVTGQGRCECRRLPGSTG